MQDDSVVKIQFLRMFAEIQPDVVFDLFLRRDAEEWYGMIGFTLQDEQKDWFLKFAHNALSWFHGKQVKESDALVAWSKACDKLEGFYSAFQDAVKTTKYLKETQKRKAELHCKWEVMSLKGMKDHEIANDENETYEAKYKKTLDQRTVNKGRLEIEGILGIKRPSQRGKRGRSKLSK